MNMMQWTILVVALIIGFIVLTLLTTADLDNDEADFESGKGVTRLMQDEASDTWSPGVGYVDDSAEDPYLQDLEQDEHMEIVPNYPVRTRIDDSDNGDPFQPDDNEPENEDEETAAGEKEER